MLFLRTAFIALLLWSVSGCNNLKTESYRSKKNDTIAMKETAENVTVDYTDSGLLRARIRSPKMVAVKNVRTPFIEMPKGLKADFFAENGRVESYLFSEYAISYTEQKRIIVRRNVRVLNIKCEQLETEELIWDQETGKIHTDKFVKITTPEQLITGEGLESNQTFTDWVILNPSGTINRKSNDSVPCNEFAVPGGSGNKPD